MRKSRRFYFVSTWALSFCLCASANAVVIDFDPLAHTGTGPVNIGTTYTEDGFTLTADSASTTANDTFYAHGTSSDLYRGSTALFHGADNGVTVLTRSDGGSFNLLSIELAELNRVGTEYNIDVTFTGVLAAGGTVIQSFNLDNVAAMGSGFQKFTFPGIFQNLVSVSWLEAPDYHQFDKIEVAAIPVPPAVWLFGSGLLGLIGIARRKL